MFLVAQIPPTRFFWQVPESAVELSDLETLNCGRVRTAAVAAMKGLMYGITDPELEQITNITLQV